MSNNDRKAMIQKAFDTAANGYDRDTMRFFPDTAERIMDHLALMPSASLLDVCTGTGCVALRAAQLLPQGSVTGIDLSSGMLSRAREKANALQLENVEFLNMDLDSLAVGEDQFDAATISFGLFFMEDMTQALNNIVASVKPGGKIAVSTFAYDAFVPMADLFLSRYEATGREVMPLSWKRLASHDLLMNQLEASGLQSLNIHHEPLGYTLNNGESWWEVVWNAGFRGLLNQLDEQELQQFRQEHLQEIEALMTDDGLWFNTEVLIGIGHRPLS